MLRPYKAGVFKKDGVSGDLPRSGLVTIEACFGLFLSGGFAKDDLTIAQSPVGTIAVVQISIGEKEQ